MEWQEFIKKRDMDGYRRMYTEMLVYTFNHILSKEWYRYHLYLWLKEKNERSKKKIVKHCEAIEWLISDDKDLCFEVLGLNNLNGKDVVKAICRKFNGDKKFIKFFSNHDT